MTESLIFVMRMSRSSDCAGLQTQWRSMDGNVPFFLVVGSKTEDV